MRLSPIMYAIAASHCNGFLCSPGNPHVHMSVGMFVRAWNQDKPVVHQSTREKVYKVSFR